MTLLEREFCVSSLSHKISILIWGWYIRMVLLDMRHILTVGKIEVRIVGSLNVLWKVRFMSEL